MQIKRRKRGGDITNRSVFCPIMGLIVPENGQLWRGGGGGIIELHIDTGGRIIWLGGKCCVYSSTCDYSLQRSHKIQ